MQALARFDKGHMERKHDKQSTSDTCSDSQGAEVLNDVVVVRARIRLQRGSHLGEILPSWSGWVIVGCVVLDERVGVCWRVGVLVNCSQRAVVFDANDRLCVQS